MSQNELSLTTGISGNGKYNNYCNSQQNDDINESLTSYKAIVAISDWDKYAVLTSVCLFVCLLYYMTSTHTQTSDGLQSQCHHDNAIRHIFKFKCLNLNGLSLSTPSLCKKRKEDTNIFVVEYILIVLKFPNLY